MCLSPPHLYIVLLVLQHHEVVQCQVTAVLMDGGQQVLQSPHTKAERGAAARPTGPALAVGPDIRAYHTCQDSAVTAMSS